MLSHITQEINAVTRALVDFVEAAREADPNEGDTSVTLDITRAANDIRLLSEILVHTIMRRPVVARAVFNRLTDTTREELLGGELNLAPTLMEYLA